MRKVLIIGSSSMVGSRVAELLEQHFSLEFADKNITLSEARVQAMDLTNEQNVRDVIEKSQAQVVIKFAAFTDVDRAEEERGNETGLAWQVNVLGTKQVALACKGHNKKLIYVSTDYVFTGDNGPYAEDDKPMQSADAGSWYGWSKRHGEIAVNELLGSNATIVRLAYPFRAQYDLKSDFVRKLIVRFKKHSLHPMFADQMISPVFVDDVAEALRAIIKENATGIWHVVGSTILSPYQAAQRVARIFGCDASEVKQGSLEEYLKDHPEARLRYPKNSALKNDKINGLLSQYNAKMHTFEESLQLMKEQLA